MRILGDLPANEQRAASWIIAEAGVNHDGDVDQALRLVEVAAECGADAVKFQTFEPSLLTSDRAALAPYQRKVGADSQQDMLARLVLPTDAWSRLAVHAKQLGIAFLSTAFDLPSAKLLVDLGVSALKVPSGELTNLPFIRALAAEGLPMILSTGLGTMEEVEAAVEAAAAAPQLTILHCVTAYPAAMESCNLRAIPVMCERLGVSVGWSDHTQGFTSAVGAVSLGATVLEKHLTLNKAAQGPDHAASEDPEGFREYVRQVRAIEAALGDGVKRPHASEIANREAARRSFHATADLQPGHTIQASDVVALRPAVGIPPSEVIEGLVLARAVKAGDPIRQSDVA